MAELPLWCQSARLGSGRDAVQETCSSDGIAHGMRRFVAFVACREELLT